MVKRKKNFYIIDENSHIGYNIKKIRSLLEISQFDVAFKLDITQQYLSKMEKKKNIEKYWLYKIAEVLEIEVNDILDFDATNPDTLAKFIRKKDTY